MVEDSLEGLARGALSMTDEAYKVAFRQLVNKGVKIVNIGRPRRNTERLCKWIAMIEMHPSRRKSSPAVRTRSLFQVTQVSIDFGSQV